MEAANFGAFMAPYGDKAFREALAVLAAHACGADHAVWIASAAGVRATLLGSWAARERRESWSLGIPTWYYGNEPPNLFASHSGKYFFNSVREDGLLAIADGGIVFGPGSAGTVQEIFQDAPLNFYRTEESATTPMVLLGIDFWNPKGGKTKDGAKPAWPLLSAMARQAKLPFDRAILLSDDSDAIVAFLAKGSARRRIEKTEARRMHMLNGRGLAER
jgi:hypothetical protein